MPVTRQAQQPASPPDESRSAPGQQPLPMGQQPDPPVAQADDEPDFDDVFETTRDPDDPGDVSETTTDASQPAVPAGDGQAILDRIRQLGIEADDERGALTALADRYESTGTYLQRLQQQQERDRQQVARLTQALLDRREQPQQPATPQQTAQPAQSAWRRVEPLKVHQTLLQAWTDPETGSLRQDAPAEVVQEFHRYRGDVENWMRDVMHNPEEFFVPGVQAVVEKLLADRLVQHDQQRETRTEFQQMQEDVRPFMFEIDPVTGQYNQSIRSQFGEQFADAYSQAEQNLRSMGIEPTREHIFKMAYWHMKPVINWLREQQNQQPAQAPEPAAPATPEQATPEDIREQRRRQHVRQSRAAGVPSTGGAPPPDNGRRRKTNPLMTVGREFSEQAIKEGVFY